MFLIFVVVGNRRKFINDEKFPDLWLFLGGGRCFRRLNETYFRWIDYVMIRRLGQFSSIRGPYTSPEACLV